MSHVLPQQRTPFLRNEDISKEWLLLDASKQRLGRLATQIVCLLRAKHKVAYSVHQDIGDYVIVTHASKLIVTGKKAEQKLYYRHTGYTGNLKKIQFRHFFESSPEKVLRLAVKRMLPSGPLGRKLLGNLYIYADGEHPHQAQKPRNYFDKSE